MQGLLQEIERVTVLLGFHSKELSDMRSEMVAKAMQVYSILLSISSQQWLNQSDAASAGDLEEVY